jgi:uncharacterized protein (TIGR02594 family)
MEPSWLSAARAEIGVREFAGAPDNPRIIKYWNDAGLANVADGQDEVPWCAAFVGAMLARSSIPHSGKANARSYETWGRKLNSPALGCVVVFSRPPHAWQGHVAFYLGSNQRGGLVQVIGGNQADSVSIASFHMDRVVAWRWPASQLIKPEWVGPLPASGLASLSNRED